MNTETIISDNKKSYTKIPIIITIILFSICLIFEIYNSFLVGHIYSFEVILFPIIIVLMCFHAKWCKIILSIAFAVLFLLYTMATYLRFPGVLKDLSRLNESYSEFRLFYDILSFNDYLKFYLYDLLFCFNFIVSIFSWKKRKSKNINILWFFPSLIAILQVINRISLMFIYSENAHIDESKMMFDFYLSSYSNGKSVGYTGSLPLYLLASTFIALAFLFLGYCFLTSQKELLKEENTTDNYAYCSLGEHTLITVLIGIFPFVYRLTRFFEQKNGTAIKKTLLSIFVPFYWYFWIYNTAKKAEKYADKKGDYCICAKKTLRLSILLGIVGTIYLQHKVNKIILLPDKAEELFSDFLYSLNTGSNNLKTKIKERKTMFTVRRFGPDHQKLSQLSTTKTKQIISIVLGVLIFFVAMYFGNLQEESWYNPDDYQLYGFLKILMIILGIIVVACSIIIYYTSSKEYDMISGCYITLYEDKIEGVGIKSNSYTSSFFIRWEDVVCAYEDVDGLVIKTVSGLIECKGIESAGSVNRIINNYVLELAKQKEETETNDEVEEIEETTQIEDSEKTQESNQQITEKIQEHKFCMNCGQKLPSKAMFCSNCGERQGM